MNRLRRYGWLAAGPAAALALYHACLGGWFFGDDFAWLGLRRLLEGGTPLAEVLFAPMAQGTIRVFSERLFFLLGVSLAGLDARPEHAAAFAVHLVNLTLFGWLVRRASGSRAAGAAAAVLWTVNAALARPLAWASSFNQLLWPCFTLAALTAREARRPFWEWVFFLGGFGALEMNVVYPALALVREPRRWRSTVPMFGVSALYAVVQRWAARGVPPDPLYALHFHPSDILSTLWQYCAMAPGAYRIGNPLPAPLLAASIAVGAALLGGAVLRARRGDWLPAQGLAWFVITLGPVLLLRDHVSDYYLAFPVAGLALTGGVLAVRGPWLAAVAVAVCYAAGTLPTARAQMTDLLGYGEEARRLVRGVEAAARLHPGQAIFLTEVNDISYWMAINDGALRLIPGVRAYLAPGWEKRIVRHPELGDPAAFTLAPAAAARSVLGGSAVVYSAAGPRLRNVTPLALATVRAEWGMGAVRNIAAGDPVFNPQFDAGWEAPDGGIRWMSERATVTLEAPKAGDSLSFVCFRAHPEARQGPVTLTVTAGGRELGRFTIPEGGEIVPRTVALPAELTGLPRLAVEFRASPGLQIPGQARPLGVAFSRLDLGPATPE